MEYRKRNRRQRRRTNRNDTSGAGGKLLLTLILIGGAVYLISASAAGTWLAQNVMAPIFEAFSAEASPVSTISPVSTGDAQTANSTAEASLPGVSAYLLQMGVFESHENAQENANELKSRGGGGYIMEDDGKYRVIAAAYANEAEAKSVRDGLKEDGIDSTVHKIVLDTMAFNVTADNDVTRTIAESFSGLWQAQEDLLSLALKFDKENLSVQEGKTELQPILSDLRADREALAQNATEEGVLTYVLARFDAYISAVEAALNYNGENTVDFSSEIKYTQIQMIDEYASLMDELKDKA